MPSHISFWRLPAIRSILIGGIVGVSACGAARAESLRCNGEIASPGDAKILVLQRCGEPMLKDSFCKPVQAQLPGYPYPVTLPPHTVPCEMVDEWMYDRGPGNLYATVRFERGVMQSVRYEGRPR